MVCVSSTGERSYRGASAPERVRRRRSQLIDVALTAMAENRWRSATVVRLCAEARLNKRYFYESFTDLDTLASAVIDEVAAEVGDAAVTAYKNSIELPLADQARAAVDAVVGVLGTDPRKALVLLGGVADSPTEHARRTDAMTGLTAILVDHARSIHGVELEYDSLASTAPAFVIGGTAQAILSWVNGTAPIGRKQLVDDISALWLAVGESAAGIARSRLETTQPSNSAI
ncbi:TetR/AcrR family transcriptional regulator [Haloechinothrix sp. YIM 98757]|uniref:TetR/AcrR family transcriptional regulator n=1 Tax=Haloechinothrix aidingensis TaxID=2752311 RepID=A0A838AF31_9PSEU|nr:TetR/AcrR family transcriptional regulator [Haloechinothrix aidingensis]